MVIAEVLIEQTPELMESVQPLAEILSPFFKSASLVVGGIFGLYLILIILRIYYDNKILKVLGDIRYDLDHLNLSKKLTYSRERKGPFRKLWGLIRRLLFRKKQELAVKLKKKKK